MNLISLVKIPKMYNLYRTYVCNGNLSYTNNSQVRHESYKCHCCGAEFRIDHRWYGGVSGGYRDCTITCPSCGKVSQNEYNRHHEICSSCNNETAPYTISLSLNESRNVITLNAKADAYNFDSYGSCQKQKVRECVKFDVKNRKTTYKKYLGHTLKIERELGSPLDTRFLQDSDMRYICADGEMRPYLKEACDLVQRLRMCIRKKYKQIHGISIGPLNTGDVRGTGRVVTQLYYIAYRMLVPDITALPETRVSCVEVFCDLDRLRKYPDSVTAFMDSYKIPNIKSYRRIIQQHPYDAEMLGAITEYIRNPDIARKCYTVLRSKYNGFYDSSVTKKIAKWLEHWTKTREPMEILRFFENSGMWLINDTYHMECMLTEQNREAYKHIKLNEEGHHWLSTKIYEQEHQDFDLEIPDEIRRRFEMQANTMKLFMPNTHYEMRDAGKYLHNCVGTYAGQVLSGECQIVFVSDDKGLLVAAIEVRKSRVVQAKLRFNKPVYQNEVVNQQIIEWAKSVGLTIDTADVAVTTKEGLQSKSA